MPRSATVTQLLLDARAGDEGAFERLWPLVYDELRRLAHAQLRRERPGHTLITTGLVHEAYLKLASFEEGAWRSRAHFFAFCSKAMRRILIDQARRRDAVKRGGDRIRVPLTPEIRGEKDDTADLLELLEALEGLEKRHPRMARIVECRFFGGMSVSETAQVLEVSVRTVERDWTRARAYLYEALTPTTAPPTPPDP